MSALNLSCRDWEARLREGRSLIPDGLPLNAALGNRAVAIFDKLRLADVPGTPTMREAGGDWFRQIVFAFFAAADPVTKARLIRELFLLVPKKNSKTTNGALLMLTALILNERPRGRAIMTAPVQDVAELAFEAASGAIHLDPVLDKLFHVRDHLKIIVHRETAAELEIMTFDPSVVTGQKVSIGALIDEVHVIAGMSKASKAIRQLRGGMLPFPQAFLAFITTQSEEPPAGVFRAELTKARAIRDGKLPGVMLPVLYEFPQEVQKSEGWRDPALWHQVTPNAGRSISIDRLVEEMATAEATSAEELQGWASQHLNIQIGIGLHADRWAGADFWEACAVEGLTLEEVLRRSEVVTIGIDGGGLDDLLGLAVVGREIDTGKWLIWNHAWAHRIVLKRRQSEAPRLLDYEKDGDLTIVDRPGEDVVGVAKIVDKVEKSGLLDRVGVDPAGITAVADAVEDIIDFERIVGIPQGWKLNGAILTLERKVAGGDVQHGGTELMNYAVGNAKVEARGNAVIITKQAAGTAKIDPLSATFDAVALMGMNPKPRRKKYQMLFVGAE